jgi:septal ring factor EnvC (AmiA/AmiB activator)
MSRRLQLANLVGVLVLVVICLLQWRRDRALNLALNQNEKVRLEQIEKIAAQEKQLQGLTDDLAGLKEHLLRTQEDLAEQRKRSQTLERDNLQLTADRAALQESVTNWMAAVTVRDERLTAANERIRDLAEQLNASVLKFNELATNYNDTVKALERLRAAP